MLKARSWPLLLLFLWTCLLGDLWGQEGTELGLISPASLPTHKPSDIPPHTINGTLLKLAQNMPEGGGYATNKETMLHLASNAVYWSEQESRLVLKKEKASPSFCSFACYFLLLQLLEKWDSKQGSSLQLSAQDWQALDVLFPQTDGQGLWGRANANGPGWAKLISDLGAGHNFSDLRQARPGDFLKIFWNHSIGRSERGHLVLFLGYETLPDGQAGLRFWSSNVKVGYGEKTVPLSDIKRLVFTRITQLSAFKNLHRVPFEDVWLAHLLKKNITPQEMAQKIRLSAPNPEQKQH